MRSLAVLSAGAVVVTGYMFGHCPADTILPQSAVASFWPNLCYEVTDFLKQDPYHMTIGDDNPVVFIHTLLSLVRYYHRQLYEFDAVDYYAGDLAKPFTIPGTYQDPFCTKDPDDMLNAYKIHFQLKPPSLSGVNTFKEMIILGKNNTTPCGTTWVTVLADLVKSSGYPFKRSDRLGRTVHLHDYCKMDGLYEASDWMDNWWSRDEILDDTYCVCREEDTTSTEWTTYTDTTEPDTTTTEEPTTTTEEPTTTTTEEPTTTTEEPTTTTTEEPTTTTTEEPTTTTEEPTTTTTEEPTTTTEEPTTTTEEPTTTTTEEPTTTTTEEPTTTTEEPTTTTEEPTTTTTEEPTTTTTEEPTTTTTEEPTTTTEEPSTTTTTEEVTTTTTTPSTTTTTKATTTTTPSTTPSTTTTTTRHRTPPFQSTRPHAEDGESTSSKKAGAIAAGVVGGSVGVGAVGYFAWARLRR